MRSSNLILRMSFSENRWPLFRDMRRPGSAVDEYPTRMSAETSY
jgi:hypothetical protein